MKKHVLSPSNGLVLAPFLALGMLGGDCNGDIVQDPTFRDWCGNSLCSWTTDTGQVSRVPTWNEHDLGVSFDAMPTQISQVTQETKAKCLLFTSVADIDPAAQMSILVDFNNDETIDFSAPLGATAWQRVQVEATAPEFYSGITYHLRKDGVGKAILAEMRVQSTTGCTGPAPPNPTRIGSGGPAIGSPCKDDSQCSGGVCEPSGCAQCAYGLFGICLNGAPCESPSRNSPAIPSQCGPGLGEEAKGAPCIANDDCVSGSCAGTVVMGANVLGDAGTCDPNAPFTGGNCENYTIIGGFCR